jgi:hypothetical protein
MFSRLKEAFASCVMRTLRTFVKRRGKMSTKSKAISRELVMSLKAMAGIQQNKKEIITNLVKQDDDYGCAIAALAMACGKTYAEMRLEVQQYWDAFFPFHPYKGMDEHDEAVLLYKHGYKFYTIRVLRDGQDGLYESFHDMLAGRQALMSVPSINIPGLYHALYWDGKKLHDPSKLKRYTAKRAWKVVRQVRIISPLETHDLFGISKGHRTDAQNT